MIQVIKKNNINTLNFLFPCRFFNKAKNEQSLKIKYYIGQRVGQDTSPHHLTVPKI